tara:strand:- start:441 stop:4481 length:4041 start_codon:yes stop_codon:yes gene_type:complete
MGKNDDNDKQKKKNLKLAQSKHKGAAKQKLVGQQLSNQHKVKSTGNLVAYDTKNNIMISGGITKISKELKIDKKELLKILNSGYSSKSFQLFRFDNADDMVNFKNKLLKGEDKQSKKKKAELKTLNRVKDGYDIVKSQSVDNAFWGTKKNSFRIKIKENLTETDIKNIIEDVINKTKSSEGLKPTDKMRLLLSSPFLESVVSTKLVNASEMNIDLIIDALIDSAVSYDGFEFNGDTEIIMESIVLPIGGAAGGTKYILKEQLIKNKNAIITIDNFDDNMCMARAIAVGLWRNRYHDKIVRASKNKGIDKTNSFGLEWEQVRRSSHIKQYELAKELCDGIGISEDDVCGIDECIEFEKFIGDKQITILDMDDNCNAIYPDIDADDYVPPFDLHDCIYILKDGDHFHHINHKFLGGLLDKHYYCHRCKKPFAFKDLHKCKFKCNMCMATDCDSIGMKYDNRLNKHCLECLRYFPTSKCYDNHKKTNAKGISVCDKLWKCPKCKVRMCPKKFPIATHLCGDYWCHNCDQLVHKDHQCYMFPKKYKEMSESYIFFDFETHIDFDKVGRTNHRVMYAVSQYFHAEDGEYIYHTSIDEWCKWALTEDHKNYTFIAHNGKGYDFVFILKWIINYTNEEPKTINDGRKIMYMALDALKIRFVDSLNFIPDALKNFPKIFGFKELRKGFFPHMFNTPENIYYKGPMPDISYFEVGSKKKGECDEILKWYKEKIDENYVWDNMEEMRRYCESDVDILRKSMIRFRKLYLEVADIDPLRYLTIASVCMAIFRFEFLDPSYGDRLMDCYDATTKEAFKNETREIIFKDKKIAVFNDNEQIEWMRQSFFGGRTNALKLIYNFTGNEEGKYPDITSLYPTTQYYDDFPKGHMKILEFDDITNAHIEQIEKGELHGIIDCVMIPPNDLYIPVLPRKGEKLIFDLNLQKGRWCSNEIKKAIDMGYELHRVKKVYYWEEMTNELFRGYVGKFLKIKQEASGYPDWVFEGDVGASIIEARKDKYIADYEIAMGIKIDKSAIEKNRIDNLIGKPAGYEDTLSHKDFLKLYKNDGLRAVAKLCLNSLWGKFGQRINLGECKIVKDKAQLYSIILDNTNDNIKWIELDTTDEEGNITQHKLQVSWTKKDEYVKNDYTTNIALATFTTANARMRLYEGLSYLNHQVLYFDTDSVIYVYDKTNPKKNKLLTLGDNLGDWTDELEGYKMVGTFCSGGPKNYSYQVDKNGVLDTTTKVKGFKLSVDAVGDRYDPNNKDVLIKKGINHLNMIGKVLEKFVNKEDPNADVFMGGEYDQFIRTDTKDITNKLIKKQYGVVYDKRTVLKVDKKGNLDTLPFGHADEPIEEDDFDS